MRAAALLALATLTLPAADLFSAIRAGDTGAIKTLLRKGAPKDAPNADGLTPLMYAVTTAGVPVMSTLLDAGANVNAATPDGITALHIAAYDLEKTRLLLDRGAAVDRKSKQGETPLLLACARPGTTEIAALLLAKGARPAADSAGQTFFLAGPTELSRAAANADVQLMRLLLANGASVAHSPGIARSAAAGHCRECLAIVLAAGADPNGATKANRSALQDAAAFGDLEMVRMLVEKGANVNASDKRGYTALMRAALSYEPGAPQVVEYLLAKGADPAPKNETGDTALSFARRFGETPTVTLLKNAGAPEPKTAVRVPPPLETNTVAEAVKRSLPLLQRIGEPVRKLDSCTTCHNHTLPAMTLELARSRGFAVDNATAAKEFQHSLKPNSGSNLVMLLGTGIPDFFPYQLIGIAAGGNASNSSIDLMVHHVSTRQDPSGRFRGIDYRPPQEYTDITFTATALRALQLHPLPGRAAEMKERVQRATRWLAVQSPRDTEEHALRLLGLTWGNAPQAARDAATKALLALQRPDGGWTQTAAITIPDAYATGQSLYALQLAGLPSSHPASQRAIDFLLKSQRKDGSWFVASRAHPVQPLIDGGYPYINHQWISAAAGSWSTLALLASLPPR